MTIHELCSRRLAAHERPCQIRVRLGSGQGTTAPQVSLRSGAGVAGWVLERGRVVRIDDVLRDARFKPVGGQGFAIRSMVAAPLWAGGNAIGVLGASSSRVAAFGERDELTTQLLANCSVPPLERARLERLAMTDHLTLAFSAGQLRAHLRAAMESRVGSAGPSLLRRRHAGRLRRRLLRLDHGRLAHPAPASAVTLGTARCCRPA